MKKTLGYVAVVTVSILVTLGLIELVGRLVLSPLLVRYANRRAMTLELANPKDLGVATLYVPHHYYLYGMRPAYRSADGGLRHNAMGCRAEDVPLEKPAGVVRIVTVGGSTTYETLVRRNDRIYTYLLERLLDRWADDHRLGRRFEVIDCGVPGATSAENLGRYMFALSDYRPDLLLVQQGLNDAIPRSLPRMSRDYREFSKTWDERGPTDDRWFLVRLVRAARNKFGSSIWTQGINFLVRRPFWDASSGADSANVAHNGPGVFRANTRYLVRAALADGAQVLLVTEHIVADKRADWRQMPPSRDRATLEHNDVLRDLARSEGVLFFDLQSALCACKAEMPDGRHLNEAGEREKAHALFDYLTRPAVAGRWMKESR